MTYAIESRWFHNGATPPVMDSAVAAVLATRGKASPDNEIDVVLEYADGTLKSAVVAVENVKNMHGQTAQGANKLTCNLVRQGAPAAYPPTP